MRTDVLTMGYRLCLFQLQIYEGMVIVDLELSCFLKVRSDVDLLCLKQLWYEPITVLKKIKKLLRKVCVMVDNTIL